MCKVTLLLAACLACASHGHRVQRTRELRQGDELDSVATLLLALNPAVAFAPSLPKAQHTLSQPGRGPLGARPLELYMQEGASPPPEETVAKVETGDVTTPVQRKPRPAKDAPSSKGYDLKAQVAAQGKEGVGFNQFDPLLSLSNFISRRFGLGGGLAFVALIAAVEGREIVNAVREPATVEVDGELITTASGLQYRDKVISKAGEPPSKGVLVGFDAKVSIGDKVLYDTQAKKEKRIAFKYGARPFENIICAGVEEGIKDMKPGSKRILYVPQDLAPPGVNIPPGLRLEYEIELSEVLPNYFLN